MDLMYKNEHKLFIISAVISCLAWLVFILGTVGVGLFYIGLFAVMYLFAQSALISYLKGTAVRITSDQFPDLHKQITECCEKLKIHEVPEAYLLHADGAFNAFVTRFLGKHFLILFSDVVDALEPHPPALNFYIGHELGHIQRKHLIWGPILFPSSLLPLLGSAYHRAREYTCDNYGFACCAKPVDAVRGLAALSAGGKRWKTLKIENYVAQTEETGGFWMTFNELISDYPWLTKRMAAIYAKATNKEVNMPGKNVFAVILACFIPRTGHGAAGGGALVSMMVVVMMIGILSAIAIPNFVAYRNKGYEVALQGELEQLVQAEYEYYQLNGNFAQSLEQLGFQPTIPGVQLNITEVADNCFQAQGMHEQLPSVMTIDCNGEITTY